ncbi:MAG: YetF domain-containing protein [Verrucomicrobiota bacterium]
MFNLSVPWWEFVIRCVVVYVFLLVMLRISGKRQIGQLSPFDFVLLLVLSNSVQNSMNAGDNSLLGGLIAATTLIILNYLVSQAVFRDKRLEFIIEGRPQILIHDGKLFEDIMARSQLTHHELNAALRQSGCSNIDEVHCAILENNGSVTVTSRKNHS